MKWRIIKLQTHDAFFNMAADEAISDAIAEQNSPPTIRFYRWKPGAVSIGHFQSMNDEVNIERCDSLGIDYIRRKTGGGAVYHDENGEITYSVIAPEGMFPKGILESYLVICGWIIGGLANLGIKAQFAPINDILVSGKKISGNAQTRRNGTLLQHGTILYDLKIETMFSLLKITNEKISDKMIKSVEDRVTSVLNYKHVSQEQLYDALLKGFSDGKEYGFGEMSTKELEATKYLSETVYRTREWNFSR
ncbi:MAG: lipoate--protein ligase family protein [Candidatus Micrarchaeota archaeon]|nr:lipoate--protein ligase family protein [Candidatus Micrarchaeota archaeon]MDE1848028.1 lipoate--protein ligase family protein [Candidatus Micrarchaeota archaeon]MDE1864595.1 lipoate--protein ligase family protein [Candidatus Micrarchaeota archaeon]